MQARRGHAKAQRRGQDHKLSSSRPGETTARLYLNRLPLCLCISCHLAARGQQVRLERLYAGLLCTDDFGSVSSSKAIANGLMGSQRLNGEIEEEARSQGGHSGRLWLFLPPASQSW